MSSATCGTASRGSAAATWRTRRRSSSSARRRRELGLRRARRRLQARVPVHGGAGARRPRGRAARPRVTTTRTTGRDATRWWLGAPARLLAARGPLRGGDRRRGRQPGGTRARSTRGRPSGAPRRPRPSPASAARRRARARRGSRAGAAVGRARRARACAARARPAPRRRRPRPARGVRRGARGLDRAAGARQVARRARRRDAARPPAGEAREPLRRALELATACGAGPLAERVRAELYAAGARPRGSALSGAASLTASERRVADLAAAGETNRDIAQSLYVTPKTVEVHLSNAYRKLGIRARRELASALAAVTRRSLDASASSAELDAIVAEAADGHGGWSLIEGPAGIGKSGCCRGCASAPAAGCGCSPRAPRSSSASSRFGVVRQLFEAALRRRRRARARARRRGGDRRGRCSAGPTARADGGARRSPPCTASTGSRSTSPPSGRCCSPSTTCTGATGRRCASSPTSPGGSRALPVLAAATLRTGEPGVDAALLAELARRPAAAPSAPGRSAPTAVAALVRARLGDARRAGVLRAPATTATGGNPLLLRQLLRTLEAEGVAPTAANVGGGRAIGPRAVASTVLLRLARLPADAAAVARAVAVLGESADAAGGRGARRASTRRRSPRDRRARAGGDPATRAAARLRPPARRATPSTTSSRPASASCSTSAPRGCCAEPARRPSRSRRSCSMAPRRGEPWVARRCSGGRRGGGARRRAGRARSPTCAARSRSRRRPSATTPSCSRSASAEAMTNGPAAVEHLQAAYERLDDPVARRRSRSASATCCCSPTAEPEAARCCAPRARTCRPSRPTCAGLLEALELATVLFGDADPTLRDGCAARRAPGRATDGLGRAQMLPRSSRRPRAHRGRAGGRVRRRRARRARRRRADRGRPRRLLSRSRR